MCYYRWDSIITVSIGHITVVYCCLGNAAQLLHTLAVYGTSSALDLMEQFTHEVPT
jgi:hypothetical protein